MLKSELVVNFFLKAIKVKGRMKFTCKTSLPWIKMLFGDVSTNRKLLGKLPNVRNWHLMSRQRKAEFMPWCMSQFFVSDNVMSHGNVWSPLYCFLELTFSCMYCQSVPSERWICYKSGVLNLCLAPHTFVRNILSLYDKNYSYDIRKSAV